MVNTGMGGASNNSTQFCLKHMSCSHGYKEILLFSLSFFVLFNLHDKVETSESNRPYLQMKSVGRAEACKYVYSFSSTSHLHE